MSVHNILEFCVWLAEQNHSKMAIDLIRHSAIERTDAKLWEWLKIRVFFVYLKRVLQLGKETNDSKLIMDARTELIKLTPTMQMWKEIKESEKPQEWEETKKKLLSVINKKSAEVVDIYLSEGFLVHFSLF